MDPNMAGVCVVGDVAQEAEEDVLAVAEEGLDCHVLTTGHNVNFVAEKDMLALI
jgi:hypothetical protein